MTRFQIPPKHAGVIMTIIRGSWIDVDGGIVDE